MTNGPRLTATVTSGERTATGEELTERAMRAANGLADLGVGPGDAVAFLMYNDIEFLVATFGTTALGAYAVPINWHFTVEEAAYVLRDSGASVLVVHDLLLPIYRGALPPGIRVLVVPTPPEVLAAYRLTSQPVDLADTRSWPDWIAAQAPRSAPPQPAPASMIYTSGTTGHPKGVRRQPPSEEHLRATRAMGSAVFGIGPGMRTVITGPLYHSSPNFYATAAVQQGELMVLQPRFDPEELLALIERHAITHLNMAPIMFVRLLRLPEAVKQRYDLSSLQWVVHAAAPCPPEIKRAMIDWWGPVINERYGATEIGPVVFCTAQEWLDRPGTVGRPVAGATVRIYGEDGQVLPTGEVGDVYARLAAMPDFTYLGRDADRRAIERDGLIAPGDVGYLDADGFLFLCDRRRDMIISGGVNIYPPEIEAALHQFPGIEDCAVFGIPDAEFGEAVAAIIEPRHDVVLDAEEIRAYLRRHLASFKVPRHIEFRTDLPREDSGKIFKRRLRAPFWEGLGRNI